MAQGKFGTAINCMDGRVQLPVINWMTEKFGLDYVDMITEPGPDKILAERTFPNIDSIKTRVLISVEKHGSEVIIITGHDGCAGNPVSKDAHREHILRAMKVIKSWSLPVSIYGLWLDSNWDIEIVETIEK